MTNSQQNWCVGAKAQQRRLKLTIPVKDGETATSFASRLSSRNGLPRLRTWCKDMAIRYADLCHGVPEAVEQVAELAGCDPAPLLFHTPCLVRPGWFRLGREQLKFTALLRNGGQLCPLCIKEDQSADQRFGRYQRAIWQIGAVRRCPTHGVALQRPVFACSPAEAHDFVSLVRSWSPTEIVPIDENDALEVYLTNRLWGDRSAEWIDGQAFHVVWLFCEALGTLLTRGANKRPHELDPAELIGAGNAGFQIVKNGPDALLNVLSDIRDCGGADRNSHRKLFAPILTCLLERRRDPEFDNIRHLVREYILNNFRVAPDTSLLGQKCSDPRVFTPITASQHYKVQLSVLNRQLRKVGLLTNAQRNHIGNPNLFISRSQMEKIVADCRQLSTTIATRTMMGADPNVMEGPIEAKLVAPHFSNDGGMPLFHQGEVRRFIRRLQAASRYVERPEQQWDRITSAARNCHCSTAWLIQQVLAKKLGLIFSLPVPTRLGDFLVSMPEVKGLLATKPESTVTAAEAASFLATGVKTVHALGAAGYLSSIMIDSRLANRPCRLIMRGAVEDFARNYIIFRASSGVRRSKYAETLAFIEEQGVSPALMCEGARPVFERQAIEQIAHLPGGEQAARFLAVEDRRLAQLSEQFASGIGSRDVGGTA